MARAPAAMPMPPEAAPDEMTAEPEATDYTVIATICRRSDGTYEVYAGDEPEEPGVVGGETGDMVAGPSGQTYDSIGATLKAVMDLMQEDAAGAEGTAEDNFRAGFGEEVPQGEAA